MSVYLNAAPAGITERSQVRIPVPTIVVQLGVALIDSQKMACSLGLGFIVQSVSIAELGHIFD